MACLLSLEAPGPHPTKTTICPCWLRVDDILALPVTPATQALKFLPYQRVGFDMSLDAVEATADCKGAQSKVEFSIAHENSGLINSSSSSEISFESLLLSALVGAKTSGLPGDLVPLGEDPWTGGGERLAASLSLYLLGRESHLSWCSNAFSLFFAFSSFVLPPEAIRLVTAVLSNLFYCHFMQKLKRAPSAALELRSGKRTRPAGAREGKILL